MLSTNSSPQIGLLNEHQVADRLNVSVATIRRWRLLGRGPRWIKLGQSRGSALRYRPADVEAFIGAAA